MALPSLHKSIFRGSVGRGKQWVFYAEKQHIKQKIKFLQTVCENIWLDNGNYFSNDHSEVLE